MMVRLNQEGFESGVSMSAYRLSDPVHYPSHSKYFDPDCLYFRSLRNESFKYFYTPPEIGNQFILLRTFLRQGFHLNLK